MFCLILYVSLFVYTTAVNNQPNFVDIFADSVPPKPIPIDLRTQNPENNPGSCFRKYQDKIPGKLYLSIRSDSFQFLNIKFMLSKIETL